MKTKLHHYSYNLKTPGDEAKYLAMVHEIEANSPEARGRKMHAIPGNDRASYGNETQNVDIDTACVFSNQWNETTESGNRRLFDWYEAAVYVNGRKSDHIKWGHWLEITPEMASVRRETRECGYCGHHYGPLHDAIPGEFCAACLDSPYLKETELHLLRLLPLVGHQERDKLTDEERSELLPAYIARQTTGNDSRAKARKDQQRADVLEKHKAEVHSATIGRDGMIWLLDHDFNIDNVIYYSHTGKFGFGWRGNGLSPSVADKLLDIISEFHFPYEIKVSDGRTLQGNIE